MRLLVRLAGQARGQLDIQSEGMEAQNRFRVFSRRTNILLSISLAAATSFALFSSVSQFARAACTSSSHDLNYLTFSMAPDISRQQSFTSLSLVHLSLSIFLATTSKSAGNAESGV
jgi:hypothetical protein